MTSKLSVPVICNCPHFLLVNTKYTLFGALQCELSQPQFGHLGCNQAEETIVMRGSLWYLSYIIIVSMEANCILHN